MYPVTERYVDTLSQTHDSFGQLDFLIDGQPVLTTARSNAEGLVIGNRESPVQFTSASVAVAAGAVRRIASSVVIVDEGEVLLPVIDQGMLVVGQSEIRIWDGLTYWDASQANPVQEELVPVFTGPITTVDLSEYPTITLGASDRMWYLLQPFSSTYSPTATLQLQDAMEALLRFKVLSTKLAFNFPTTNHTIGPQTYDEQSSPADAFVAMATAAGWVVYCDPMGTFVAETEPELRTQDVVFTYAAPGMLIRPKKSYDAANVKNTWVVTGEAASSGQTLTPYAKVVDDDPTSPTYVRVPADERPDFWSSPILQTDAQCLLAAKTRRRKFRGLAFQMDAEVFPNPALERGDVVLVDDGDQLHQPILADNFVANVPHGQSQTVTGRIGALDEIDDAA